MKKVSSYNNDGGLITVSCIKYDNNTGKSNTDSPLKSVLLDLEITFYL